jgi:hypothetical protein
LCESCLPDSSGCASSGVLYILQSACHWLCHRVLAWLPLLACTPLVARHCELLAGYALRNPVWAWDTCGVCGHAMRCTLNQWEAGTLADCGVFTTLAFSCVTADSLDGLSGRPHWLWQHHALACCLRGGS